MMMMPETAGGASRGRNHLPRIKRPAPEEEQWLQNANPKQLNMEQQNLLQPVDMKPIEERQEEGRLLSRYASFEIKHLRLHLIEMIEILYTWYIYVVVVVVLTLTL